MQHFYGGRDILSVWCGCVCVCVYVWDGGGGRRSVIVKTETSENIECFFIANVALF